MNAQYYATLLETAQEQFNAEAAKPHPDMAVLRMLRLKVGFDTAKTTQAAVDVCDAVMNEYNRILARRCK
jgi:thiamine monophosphate kinase